MNDVVEEVLAQFRRLKRARNETGQRHLAAWATEARVAGSAAQRRRARRQLRLMMRQLVAEAAA